MSKNENSIQETIRKFFIDHAWLQAEEELLDTESLLDRGVIDSMAMVELTAFISLTYAFEIEDEDLMPENFDSLAAIAAYIEKKKAC